MNLLITLVVNTLGVIATAYILQSGVHISSPATAVIVAIVLGVINMFVKPFITILTLPLSILTLGLFSFVINALLILLVSVIVPGFAVHGFLWALAFGIVLSIINAFLNALLKG